MSYEEARRIILTDFEIGTAKTADALCKAVDALAKQIPMKPIEEKNLYPPEQFACPVCGGCVGRHKTLKRINNTLGDALQDCKVEFSYCLECGQRIDWSDYDG
jgi:hypothetical protein